VVTKNRPPAAQSQSTGTNQSTHPSNPKKPRREDGYVTFSTEHGRRQWRPGITNRTKKDERGEEGSKYEEEDGR
jgi:hypothetical protein